MKGHIRRRSKGSWTLWVDLGRDPETGKRKQQTLTVRGSKRDAEPGAAGAPHPLGDRGLRQTDKANSR